MRDVSTLFQLQIIWCLHDFGLLWVMQASLPVRVKIIDSDDILVKNFCGACCCETWPKISNIHKVLLQSGNPILRFPCNCRWDI